jgi:putative oxidoreductase
MQNKLVLASRVFLGLVFTVFGLNGFLQFLPMPALPEPAMQFMGGLAGSGYFFPLLKGTEVVCGLALLANRFTALALVILAPIVIHIFLFHLVLTPGLQNSALPIVIIAASLITAYGYKHKYAELLKP